MARNKRPALTSPWKIGFLVSLLLVAVSIGVGYLITRSFGLSWSWIEFHGSWNDFTFRQDAFMTEMLPMAVTVPVMALLAYLVVTGAVRKYRRYLDSGVDYKRLIQTIAKIENLEDDAPIRKLSNYPELRDFLLKIRSNVIEREKAAETREAELNAGESVESPGENETLGKEVDILISAIMAGADAGLQRELALTIPELKRIEGAVREHLGAAGRDDAELAAMREDLERKAGALRGTLDEIREELAQSEQNARELESEMGTLRAHANAAGPAAGGAEALERAVSRLDSISEVLKALGEETRGVAIHTALEATSSEASGEAVVNLADGVRDIAVKFNGVAAEWDEASGTARAALVSSEGNAGSSPRVGESLDTLSQKVSRWVERSVILNEKVKSLQTQWVDAAVAESDAPAPPGPSAPEDVPLDTPDPAPADTSDFETTSSRMTLEPDADTPPVDTTGFEKQEGLFSELATPAQESTEMFADIPPEKTASPSPESESIDLPSPQDEVTEPAAPKEYVIDEEPAAPSEYVIDEEPAAPKEYVIDEEPAAPKEYVIDDVPAAPSPDADTGYEDMITGPRPSQPSESDAVDLYELGAVDYEPENVHHNA